MTGPGVDPVAAGTPVLAVVGRPNVGKSTLVNRLIGRRSAVVQDVPGVTRDRVAYEANWAGRDFTVLDTGGWQRSTGGLGDLVSEQAHLAVAAADVVLLVVDGQVGVVEEDQTVARVLRRAGKPVFVAVNKIDDLRAESDAATGWSLGLGEPLAVSALHGQGSGDLLDRVVAALPPAPVSEAETAARRVAIVGRPNVGKSSLLNRLLGEPRAVVHQEAGTTRDPVDGAVTWDGEVWRFIDTAGIRRRVKTASGAEYYASLRTAGALRAADIAVVMLDASQPITEQDQRILSLVEESGRAAIVAFNKWDLVDTDRRAVLEEEKRRELIRVSWAPRLNVSAATGRGVGRLPAALRQALANWGRRIPTAQLNSWVSEVTANRPHPVRGGRQPRVLFTTQAGAAPPRFVLFTTGQLEPAYQRFLERRLREDFEFTGTPLRLAVRPRGQPANRRRAR